MALCGAVAVCFVLVIALSSVAAAQTRDQKLSPLSPDKAADDDRDKESPLDEEMAAKRAIKAADKEYQDNLSRARDLSVLSEAIVTSFKEKKLLDREDIKKLEKVEKLAKGVRREAGVSDA